MALEHKSFKNKMDKKKRVKALISKKGYGVFLDSISEKELKELEKALTVKPTVLSDYDFGNDNSFPVYRLSDTRIYIPKFYGLKKYGAAEGKVKDGVDANIDFKGSLKEHQFDFCDRILKELEANNSCIASMTTGGGKTVVALWLASQFKKRTLIIVHKQFLLDQWIERIKQFLPNSTIGIIKQNEFDIDKDIVIGMIQTLTKRDYPEDAFKSIHFTIYDEAHHLGAQVFSQTFFKTGTKLSLGLSATIKRTDGLTKVIEWFLGSIIKNEILSEIEKPTVKFVECEYSTNIVPKFNFKGNLNAPNMINQLVIDPARNQLIVDEIVSLNKEGRKTLILSGRRGHCEFLANELLKINKKLVIGLYLGGMKNEDLETSNKADIIFATYSMASEAYDNPDLDTLVMATGMGAVQQAIGRILRKKNKFNPLVVDFTDIMYFGGQARRRKEFYKKSDYKFFGSKEKLKELDLGSEPEIDTTVCLFEE
jgi:superfamily II DNA or RNA helicase